LNNYTWAKAIANQASFDEEQGRLGGIWTLLGLTTDAPNDGDWFRATLGGRSVFVQRFGNGLRGFENVCAHRFYPLRTTERGHGPIRCGFHHWQYNEDGLALGIPKCQELFGKTPRELNARLKPIEIAKCGSLVFGRITGTGSGESLEDFLGEGFPILRSISAVRQPPPRLTSNIAAYWKFGVHISLDDYHLVAVHPTTFGKGGYLSTDKVKYFRFGHHSAYFYGADENAFTQMAHQCSINSYVPTDYRIFQIFPNLILAHFEAARNWYVIIQQYVPQAFDKTLLRSWYFPNPFQNPGKGFVHELLRFAVRPFLPLAVPYYIRRITGEDNAACEQLQTIATQIREFPILTKHEERIGWFEQTYADVMGNGRPNASVADSKAGAAQQNTSQAIRQKAV
jgi:phenylpropionate dioxygenase-like ring-hydroxylating dioxygenase large terminal subunit